MDSEHCEGIFDRNLLFFKKFVQRIPSNWPVLRKSTSIWAKRSIIFVLCGLRMFTVYFQMVICTIDKKTGEKKKSRFVRQDEKCIMRLESAEAFCLEPFKVCGLRWQVSFRTFTMNSCIHVGLGCRSCVEWQTSALPNVCLYATALMDVPWRFILLWGHIAAKGMFNYVKSGTHNVAQAKTACDSGSCFHAYYILLLAHLFEKREGIDFF